MAQITVYMNYVIFFRDQAEYQAAVAISGSPLLEMAPRDAAALFGIPHPYPSGDMDTISKGIYFLEPFFPGSNLNFPLDSGLDVNDAVPSQLVPGQAGVPASIFPAGPDGLHVWSGTIIRSAGAGSGIAPPGNAIAQRRWALGFEHASDLDGATGAAVGDFSRDASRTIDGCGLRAGGPSNRAMNITVNAFRTALVTATSWERFYFRARKQPPAATSDIGFWRPHFSAGASQGVALIYNNSGTIRIFNVSGAGVFTDKGLVSTPTLNTWYRFDIFIKGGTFGVSSGIVKIYIDGVLVQSFTDSTAGEGIGNAGNHASTDFGQFITNTNIGYIDLDDWINADLPSNVSASTLDFVDADFPIDWLVGSHVRRHFSDSASLVNWTPNDFAILGQDMNPSRLSSAIFMVGAQLQSSTSGAQIDGLTDAPLQSVRDSIANVLGVASAVISQYGRNAAGTDGQLGYRKAGGAVVQSVVNEQNTDANTFVAYQPSAMIIPDEVSPFSVIKTKSADANANNTLALAATIEYLGVWGPEDDPVYEYPISRLTFLHNCLYANTQWGYVGSEPAMPVYAVGGTYVGNGTTQDIVLPGPCHFIIVRKTNAAAGQIWFAPSLGPTQSSNNDVTPTLRVFCDSAGVFKLRVWNNDPRINENASNYQYIAFCDPGMRFNITGVFAQPVASPTPQINPLISSTFLADCGFIQDNFILSAGGTSNGLWFKGPGFSGNVFAELDGAGDTGANGGNFAAGILNTFSVFHAMGNHNNWVYSLWRTSDGGGAGCSNVMIQTATYVGNGAGGTRIIPLAPLSGRFPLFVYVQPSNGVGKFRDPSHAGVNSSGMNNFGLDGGTGIEAVGTDQITVGSSLNANLVTYTVFAICGQVGSMANGTYFPTYCVPDGPWLAPSAPSADILVIGDGGLSLNGQAPLLMLQDVSGIYTLVPGKLNDTLQDRQTGQTSVEVPILPIAKTGYIGG